MHINPIKVSFLGKREDRNTVSQLARNNNYSLTEVNQRRINEAIDNLSKVKSKSNMEFLLATAENLKYEVNIENNKSNRQNWKDKLNKAATNVMNALPEKDRKKYKPIFDSVFNTKKELTETEKEILSSRDFILKHADLKSLDNVKDENLKNLERNLDYFVVSSETTAMQKNYILKRLAHFMSDDYKINPQLKDKKTLALAEMVNDIVITTPESTKPNIKAINQRSHSMCAAISICRKTLAYEDKVNYIDSIMSELDNSDTVMVYDRMNLGSNTRVPVKKADIDFDYALSKGYRIVDASAMQWMQIANMYGNHNEILNVYTGFDKENFDVKGDAFFHPTFDDENLAKDQKYYQSLLKARNELASLKSRNIATKERKEKLRTTEEDNLELIKSYSGVIRNKISSVLKDNSPQNVDSAFRAILDLETSTSSKLEQADGATKDYKYIPNEEPLVKELKISLLLSNLYGVKVDEKDLAPVAKDILEYVTDYHTTVRIMDGNHLKTEKIQKAKSLYEAEAAYRAQVVAGLNVPSVLIQKMHEYNIPDDESRILEGIKALEKRIDKPNQEKLIAKLAKSMDIPNDKQEVKAALADGKTIVELILTQGLDALYSSILLGSQNEVLKNEIDTRISNIDTYNNDDLAFMATSLNVPANKKEIVKELNNLKESLNDDKNTTKVLNKLGNKNHLDVFQQLFTVMAGTFINDSYSQSVFNKTHGLPETSTEEDTVRILTETQEKFAKMQFVLDTWKEILESEDENGNPITTISPDKLILKKLETQGELTPEKTLRKMQDRFTKLDALRAEDHMDHSRKSINQKELTTLSNEEKEALVKIKKSINKKYAEVVRDFKNQQIKCKQPLEELKRFIGLNSGNYFVHEEGSSGMFSNQEVKIFEQLTDRPYYINNSIDNAVEQLKKSPYSAVSSTSVSHNFPGMHAQYVVDITKEKVGNEEKDILYHDNSWGAIEDENTWTDTNGMKRTDYSSNRGGELGYITNDRLFNGNIADNLKKKGKSTSVKIENKVYKKLAKQGDDYTFDMCPDFIMHGYNPNAKELVDRLKDNRFTSASTFINTLEKKASKMTRQQLEQAFGRIENAGFRYSKEYQRLKQEFTENKTIQSEKDFKNLPDNNRLKLISEKIALLQNYSNQFSIDEISKINDIKTINKLNKKQKNMYKNNFDYAFSKNPEVIKVITKTNQEELIKILSDVLNNYNLKLENENLHEIITNSEKPEKYNYDGSLKELTELFSNNLADEIINQIPKTEKQQEIKNELKSKIQDLAKESLYFNKADLKNLSGQGLRITKWIDKEFNPESDEAFVELYQELQDMNKSDFGVMTEDITSETLGYKEITGYDVFKNIKDNDKNTVSWLKNVIFYENYAKDIKLDETTKIYQYNKTEKINNGAIYKNSRSFDSIYKEFYNSLSTLETEKLIKGMKDFWLREYGAYPAFPSIDVADRERINEEQGNALTNIKACIEEVKNCRIREQLFETATMLNAFNETISKTQSMTPKMRKEIDNALISFKEATFGEPSFENLHEAISEITQNKTVDLAKYTDTMKSTADEINKFKMLAGKTQSEIKEESLNYLKQISNDLLNYQIHPKYKNNVKTSMKKWMKAEINDSINANKLEAELKQDLEKYLFINYPTDILKEYLLSKSSDSTVPKDLQDLYKDTCKSLLELSNIVEMQEILMDIVGSGDVSAVKKELFERTIDMQDKNRNEYSLKIGSDDMLDYMLTSLITGDDYTTAAMFTEKLGLTDKLVEIQLKKADFDKYNKIIDNLKEITEATQAQINIANDVITSYEGIINDENYHDLFKKIKQEVMEQTKKLKNKTGVRKFIQSLNNIEKAFDANPNANKSELLKAYKMPLLESISGSINKTVENAQKTMEFVEFIYNYINSLYIPETSKVYQAKEDFNNQYNELFSKLETEADAETELEMENCF